MNTTSGALIDQKDSNVSTLQEQEYGDEINYNILRCFLLIISTLLILTLNPFCLLVLRNVDSIQETSKVFLRSMSTADLGVGIFVAVPMTASAISENWPFGDVLCGLYSFISSVFSFSSQLSLLMLTVDRYISVVYALRYHSLVTVKHARIAVGCTWGITALVVTGFGLITKWQSVYSKDKLLCTFYSQSTSEIFNYAQASHYGITIICLLVILTAYTRLFMISRHHARRIDAINNQIAFGRNQPAVPRPSNKSLHTLLIIGLTALFLNILPLLNSLLSSNTTITNLFMFVLPILTKSWLNVLIYYILRNTEFRQAARSLLISQYQFFKRHIPCTTN